MWNSGSGSPLRSASSTPFCRRTLPNHSASVPVILEAGQKGSGAVLTCPSSAESCAAGVVDNCPCMVTLLDAVCCAVLSVTSCWLGKAWAVPELRAGLGAVGKGAVWQVQTRPRSSADKEVLSEIRLLPMAGVLLSICRKVFAGHQTWARHACVQ